MEKFIFHLVSASIPLRQGARAEKVDRTAFTPERKRAENGYAGAKQQECAAGSRSGRNSGFDRSAVGGYFSSFEEEHPVRHHAAGVAVLRQGISQATGG